MGQTEILLEKPADNSLYSGVRALAVKILNRIDRTDAYLDKLLESEIKNNEISVNDKNLLYEIVHGVIRYSVRIDHVISTYYKGQFSKCIPNLKNALRVAIYQILFLEKIPDYAAVNEAVEFVKRLHNTPITGLTNALLRNIVRNKSNLTYPDPKEDFINYLCVYYSYPLWMVKRWLARYGAEETERLLEACNTKPSLSIRVNKLKTNKEELSGLLAEQGIVSAGGEYLGNYLYLKKNINLTESEYFDKGFFCVQDEAQGFACLLLDVKRGMKVLDLCAAPGGKTIYLAELMENEGEIVALDKFDSRINILRNNLSRAGVDIVSALGCDAIEFEGEGFERVLVDAPCSGLGTIAKKPDIKWKRDIGDIRKLSEIQYKLLCKASECVAMGGAIVYSTCTIEPEENFDIVNKFLKTHENFSLADAGEKFEKSVVDANGCIQTLPHLNKIDGAFAAKLVRLS
jgi:16S rRNA (cytosine967-C5)-methyltransferase